MPVRIWGAGGNSGRKSCVLPELPEITTDIAKEKIIISWTQPESGEMDVEKYNVYYSYKEPATLSDMSLLCTVPSDVKSVVVDNAIPDKIYYISVQPVGVNKYENASIKQIKTEKTWKRLYLYCYYYNSSYVSEDLIEWSAMQNSVKPSVSVSSNYAYMNNIEYVKDRFICTGTYGMSGYSLNGRTWVTLGSLNTSSSTKGRYYYIKFVFKNIVYCQYYNSSDGFYRYTYEVGVDTKWKSYTANSDYSINGKDVICSCLDESGEILYSVFSGFSHIFKTTDGFNWVSFKEFSNIPYMYYMIKVGNLFVGVTQSGIVYFDINAETWVTAKSMSTTSPKCLVYGHGHFIASMSSSVYYSIDGKTWNYLSSSVISKIANIIVEEDRFVAVDTNGSIYYSLNGEVWVLVKSGAISGNAGHTFAGSCSLGRFV